MSAVVALNFGGVVEMGDGECVSCEDADSGSDKQSPPRQA
jgi:hypothetical protein